MRLSAVAEADRGRRLALAGGGRVDGGDEDQLAVGPAGEALDRGEVDLGDVLAIGFERLVRYAGLLGDRLDTLHLGLPRDLDVAERLVGILSHSCSPVASSRGEICHDPGAFRTSF